MAGFLRRMIPKRFRKERLVVPVVRLSGVIASGGGPLRQSLNLSGISQALEKAFNMKASPRRSPWSSIRLAARRCSRE